MTDTFTRVFAVTEARKRCYVRITHCTLWALCFIYLVALAGCTTLARNPVPFDQMRDAEIVGMPSVRSTHGEFQPWIQERMIQTVHDDPPENYRANPDGSRSYDVLALSGGGPNGAFGAGILYGWSNTGTRPTFKIVSGISTGALIAPFAFLGPEYDEQLKKVYTTISTGDVLKLKSVGSAIWGESLADSAPLARQIEKYIDESMLEAVARAYRGGRYLLVGTTNLDVDVLVVWNMGAIADSGHLDSLVLFRKVMLASSSIPAVLPPVMFTVEVDGMLYDEMHVDGNTTNSAFFHGGLIDVQAGRAQLAKEGIDMRGGALYIIQSGKLTSTPEHIPRRVGNIIARSLATVLRANRTGDLYRMYVESRKADVGFNYIAIPGDYELTSNVGFEPDEMKRLFELGVRLGSAGTTWQNAPPGFEGR